jgi:hypothetical protein
MNQIIMSSMRGTKSSQAECVFRNWITENKQLKSVVSKTDGQKISSCKGTNTLWIKKQPQITSDLPTRRVIVVDKGTRRLVVEN